jgi:hypothetical protein
MSNEPLKRPEPTKTTGDIDEVVCPKCEAKDNTLEFQEEVDAEREAWYCPHCKLRFVVGWDRHITYVWWEDPAGTEHEVWNTNTIIVEVRGGVVEVHKPGHLDHVKVIVRDYDIDGADEEELTQDPDGEECREEEI